MKKTLPLEVLSVAAALSISFYALAGPSFTSPLLKAPIFAGKVPATSVGGVTPSNSPSGAGQACVSDGTSSCSWQAASGVGTVTTLDCNSTIPGIGCTVSNPTTTPSIGIAASGVLNSDTVGGATFSGGNGFTYTLPAGSTHLAPEGFYEIPAASFVANTYTLSEAEYTTHSYFEVSGTPAANQTVIVPDNLPQNSAWDNAFGGGYDLLIKHAATAAITIPNASRWMAFDNGVTVERASAGTVTNTGTLGAGKLILGNGGTDVTVSSADGVIFAASGVASTKTIGVDILAPNGDGSALMGITASQVSVTSRNSGNSTDLDVAFGNHDAAITAEKITGFESWGGAGNYYSIATNQLTLLRGGTGYIAGKKVSWSGGQTTAAFTSDAAHWIYIDSTGTIGMTTSRTHTLYNQNIILFEVHYDGTNYEVVWENHVVSFDLDLEEYVHESVGTILTPIDGSNAIGATMTRVTTGTGSVATDRQIKIVGTADVNDGGVYTNIPDSGGTAITWVIYYTNALGQWKEYSSTTTFPMVWNNAGVPEALATSGATDTAIFTCYGIKGEPNSNLATYVCVMGTSALATDAAALQRIADGLNAQATGTLFQALEPAQLGHVIVTNNVTGGYISTMNVAKATLRSGTSSGGSSVASGVVLSTVDFQGGLSAADSNVQLAMNTLDKLEKLGASIASASTTDLSTTTGNYVHITGSTTIASFGTHTAGHLFQLVFDAAPLITYNATTMILPGNVDLQTEAGAVMIVRSEGSGTTGSSGNIWRVIAYTPRSVTGTGATVRSDSPTLTTPAFAGLATGSGVASAATASTLSSRDANGSSSFTNANLGFTTTVTAAGTTTLTCGSTFRQVFTGTTTQTAKLPQTNATGCAQGMGFHVDNDSTGAVTLQDFGAGAVATVPANSSAIVWAETSANPGVWGFILLPDNILNQANTWTAAQTLPLPTVNGVTEGSCAPTITTGAVTLSITSVMTGCSAIATDIVLNTTQNTVATLPTLTDGQSLSVLVCYGGTHTFSFTAGGGQTLRYAGGTAPTTTSVNATCDQYSLKKKFNVADVIVYDAGRNIK